MNCTGLWFDGLKRSYFLIGPEKCLFSFCNLLMILLFGGDNGFLYWLFVLLVLVLLFLLPFLLLGQPIIFIVQITQRGELFFVDNLLLDLLLGVLVDKLLQLYVNRIILVEVNLGLQFEDIFQSYEYSVFDSHAGLYKVIDFN